MLSDDGRLPPLSFVRIVERLQKARADTGVFARWYAQDVEELLTYQARMRPEDCSED